MLKWKYLVLIVLCGAALVSFFLYADAGIDKARAPSTEASKAAAAITSPQNTDTVVLSNDQITSLKIAPAHEKIFSDEKEEIGTISFNEDLTVQVYPPYAGRIISVFGETGQNVKKGDILFTLDSPDLLQAVSSVISAAGVSELTTRNLKRLRELLKTHATAEKDVEQAISDQQSAEGALHTARNTLHVFGKTDAEIDNIIEHRLADATLIVKSPVDGRITLRNASPGLFVQPGSGVAPYTVANMDTMWMIANVPEMDSPAFRPGQRVQVKVDAFPGRSFDGQITLVDAMVDPNTRRVLVRSEVKNPDHELRSGMFSKFVIWTGDPSPSIAVPLNAVVREGDGSMTVWVSEGANAFGRRVIQTGAAQDGFWQILKGLKSGERVVAEGGLFLSNESSGATE
ncbi:efflux transporter periplasmic adaptor subunit [Hyphomicrobium methylovorum]|uniref:efflux RND transporter periplasmic adaptor subunit n=1 Tax=Hyphomicrobium methylovorum TaxID=84 RepID=UPI001AEEAF05|nr:efflux RND transporter periplasmic adaptor subunit [Hyphomicrobium methylovorum]MBA2124739.1 efflux transporter periplasmic adaptor subunit [Hyphomicrobium methylovorum]